MRGECKNNVANPKNVIRTGEILYQLFRKLYKKNPKHSPKICLWHITLNFPDFMTYAQFSINIEWAQVADI